MVSAFLVAAAEVGASRLGAMLAAAEFLLVQFLDLCGHLDLGPSVVESRPSAVFDSFGALGVELASGKLGLEPSAAGDLPLAGSAWLFPLQLLGDLG